MMTAATFDKSDTRGVPSLVWRAGQNRRLDMIRAAAGDCLDPNSRLLVDGSGIGMYIRGLRRFSDHVYGLDIEPDRVSQSRLHSPLVNVAAGEWLPYADESFDLVLSHEVIEHVTDDRQSVAEMVRVLRPGGRAIIFCPNRLYPFETHGHYWRGHYHFGNTPFINYLPNSLRNRFAPHVRAYTQANLRHLLSGLPVSVIKHTQIYPGYDNLAARRPKIGNLLRTVTYTLENTPLRAFGLSHLLVLQKSSRRMF
jgi:SAM-dependent methyltransferase